MVPEPRSPHEEDGAQHLPVNCTKCHQPIPPERLEAVPDATLCVPCLRAGGDVPQKRGRMVFDHKTGGQLEVLSPEQFETMKELPGNIEERVSRL